jgi:hypothetical protein
MKVTNWRRKLAATLIAGGMISPAAAQAANLDTNLVVNPGFESVDFTILGDYGAPKVNNWSGEGFTYSHNPATTGVPDYADGSDPPSAGDWYFTANNQQIAATGDIREPDVFYQDLAVNSGATGTQIAAGEAAVRFSGYMSSYLNDNDFGIMHLQFRNSGGTTIGVKQIEDTDPGPDNVWSLTSGVAFVPPDTASIRVSLFGGVRNGGTDGYIDNVDVQVTNAANVLLFAQVNTTTGQVSIRNQTGQAVAIDYYEITSASGALVRGSWTSLQDQNLAGFPAGNGSGNGWEEGGGGGNGALSESHLTGNSLVNNAANIGLGAAFNTAGAHDLVFQYGVLSPQIRDADFDGDGDVDGSDFLRWQRGVNSGTTKAQGDADGDMDVDGDDLTILKAEFGQSAFGGPSTLVQGFVRYVTSAAVGVPEPGSMSMVGMGLFALPLVRRSNETNSRK